MSATNDPPLPTNKQNKNSELLAEISHRLRTPLAIMKCNLELALKEETDSFHDALSQISDNIDEIALILRQLSYAANSQSEIVTLDPITIDLSTLLQEIHDQFKPLAPNLEFKIKLNPDIHILGHKLQLKELLYNLYENACKYTPSGAIYTSLERKSGEAILIIRDTGIGIPKSDITHIFQKSYRAKNARVTSSGQGIGLNLIKKIIKNHNGEIRVASRLKVGTQFTITFPPQTATVNPGQR